jgi:TatA/E family protein of Tat protein translocase
MEGVDNMGSQELMVVLVIVVLLFGASAIPKLAKSVGEARKEFDKALREDEKDEKIQKVETKNSEQ